MTEKLFTGTLNKNQNKNKQIRQVLLKHHEISSLKTVIYCWILSHIGIYGNRKVDKNAKESLNLEVTDFKIPFNNFNLLLAHLSRRLIGELIGYSWSVVRPSTMLKDLLLQKRLANQSQILCGASMGRGNESLFAASGSHDQDGRHAHIW